MKIRKIILALILLANGLALGKTEQKQSFFDKIKPNFNLINTSKLPKLPKLSSISDKMADIGKTKLALAAFSLSALLGTGTLMGLLGTDVPPYNILKSVAFATGVSSLVGVSAGFGYSLYKKLDENLSPEDREKIAKFARIIAAATTALASIPVMYLWVKHNETEDILLDYEDTHQFFLKDKKLSFRSVIRKYNLQYETVIENALKPHINSLLLDID